jgi:hypothetical protein
MGKFPKTTIFRSCIAQTGATRFFSNLISLRSTLFLENRLGIYQARNLIDEFINFYIYERMKLKTKLTPFEKRCQLT